MSKLRVNNKVVGDFDNGTYRTARNFRQHYYRKGRGYPISVSILEELKALSCHTIIIDETTSTGARVLHHFVFDVYDTAEVFQYEGYDAQKCVPLFGAYRKEDIIGKLDW
jgi:hypothetical protein